MPLAELSRRLENMIRIGTVAAVDHAAHRVRVQSGALLTDWLKWRTARAGATRTWCPPTVGEQVMILSPSGELANGIVLPSIFSDAHDAPSDAPDLHLVEFPDGARIAYDHAAGALTVTGIKTAVVQAAESITVDTPLTHITGAVQIDGPLTVDGLVTYRNGMSGTGGANGNAITITGDVSHSDGSLSSNGIVLHTHTHTDPQGGSTGAPT